MVAYQEEVPLIKSDDTLIRRSSEVTSQKKYIKFALPKDLWEPY